MARERRSRERDWVDDMIDEWGEQTRRLRAGLPIRGSGDFTAEDNALWSKDMMGVVLRAGLASEYEMRTALQSGWNLRLPCPLEGHRSFRPFSVDLERGVWHCWSCGKGGGSMDLEVRLYRLKKVSKKLDTRT